MGNTRKFLVILFLNHTAQCTVVSCFGFANKCFYILVPETKKGSIISIKTKYKIVAAIIFLPSLSF